MKSKSFLSPAKVNLFLRVLKQRSDGYHELASLFQAVNLYDIIHFSLNNCDLLTTSDPMLETDETNLINRAIALFRTRTNKHFFIKVHVEKNIPQQAGLGGGSSNAATTLWALNTLLDSPCTPKELSEMATVLGSDVAFFLSNGTSYCTGRGEIIEQLAPLQTLKPFVVVKPPFGISTKQIYNAFNANEVPKRNPKETLMMWLQGKNIFYNDLEYSAFSLNSEMVDIRERLLTSGFERVEMCGSGSSFLCFGKGCFSGLDKGFRTFNVAPIQRNEGSWYIA